MKRGFTLVELLAVIVILAIIALIVTPVVGNIITSARVAANARSVEGHIRNVELAIITEAFTKETGDLTIYDMTDGSIPSSIIDRMPNNDSIFCMKYTIENGTVLSASGCVSNINNWNKPYSYTNTTGAKATGTNNISLTLTAAGSGDTHKGIVYMDPTDLTVECTSSSTIDATSTTGCKKFFIYNDEGNTYKLIMDRNLGATVQWISKADYIAAGGTEEEYGERGKNYKGPITINKALKNMTTGWVGSPRLITADEIAHIVGADLDTTIKWDSSKPSDYDSTGLSININTTIGNFYLDGGRNSNKTSYSATNGWQHQYTSSTVKSNYIWLYDYTNSCTVYGCDTALSSNLGYWTSTATENIFAFHIRYTGGVFRYYVNEAQYGIRPVIELPKALFNI